MRVIKGRQTQKNVFFSGRTTKSSKKITILPFLALSSPLFPSQGRILGGLGAPPPPSDVFFFRIQIERALSLTTSAIEKETTIYISLSPFSLFLGEKLLYG